MYLTERAAEQLQDATISGLHTLERATGALWGSVANMPRLDILEDSHDNLSRIDFAAVEVRNALDKAMQEVHAALRAIDALL